MVVLSVIAGNLITIVIVLAVLYFIYKKNGNKFVDLKSKLEEVFGKLDKDSASIADAVKKIESKIDEILKGKQN